MPVKSDKRTSNLFIAGGYCLVAIIILFNYLGQTDSKDRVRPVQPTSEAPAAPGSDSISRQLEEEKRLNLEMRDIIRRLQGAIKDPAAVSAMPENEQPTAENSLVIPELKDDLGGSFKKVSNPFIPGKNPFAAPRSEMATTENAESFSQFSNVQCNSKMPFVFSASNSTSGYFSNH